MRLVFVLAIALALFGVSSCAAVTFSSGEAVTIDENVPAGTTLMTVNATTTGKAPVTYTVTAQSPAGLYTVNATTGVITVASEQTIDAETTQSHTVTITGTDATADNPLTETSTITVTVTDKNDNPPTFSGLTGTLPASATTGTIGTYAASDTDIASPNKDIASYSLACTTALEVSNAGVVTVKSGATGPVVGCYSIVITAVDNGTSPGALTGSGTISIAVGGATCSATWTDMCPEKSGSPFLTFSLVTMMLGLLTSRI